MSEATFALGGDLVVIDNHPPKARMRGKKKEICEIWRGKVISLTGLTKTFKGKKVATLREVKAQGMFHPNCTHGYQPLTSDVRQDLLT